jgi:hypothetical protein
MIKLYMSSQKTKLLTPKNMVNIISIICSYNAINAISRLEIDKVSLKIPLESVNWRTDRTMTKKVQQNKERSTKHAHKAKDRVTRTLLKTWGELWCSGRVGSSCSSSGTSRVNLLTNLVISHEWGKDREVFTSETPLWSFVTQKFHNGQPSHGGDRKTFEVMTST